MPLLGLTLTTWKPKNRILFSTRYVCTFRHHTIRSPYLNSLLVPREKAIHPRPTLRIRYLVILWTRLVFLTFFCSEIQWATTAFEFWRPNAWLFRTKFEFIFSPSAWKAKGCLFIFFFLFNLGHLSLVFQLKISHFSKHHSFKIFLSLRAKFVISKFIQFTKIIIINYKIYVISKS